jgi:hypothetical protein
MTPAHVSSRLRQEVVKRAEGQCEYCLFPQDASFLPFEVEPISAEKHGGETSLENLALASAFRNRFKGTDLGSLDPQTGNLTPFFKSRTQSWNDHFQLEGAQVVPVTPEGRVTIAILQINPPDRIAERERLLAAGHYMIPD